MTLEDPASSDVPSIRDLHPPRGRPVMTDLLVILGTLLLVLLLLGLLHGVERL